MTPALITAFVLCFVVGPMIYAIIFRRPLTKALIAALAISVVALLLFSNLFKSTTPSAALLCMWVSWVLAITLVVRALYTRLRTQSTRRWTYIAGMIATTAPWFGLATAKMMSP